MKAILKTVAVAAFLILGGCGKHPQPTPAPTPTPTPGPEPAKEIPIKLAATVTKVTDQEFESGEKIGLYVVNRDGSALSSTGNHVTNAAFTFDGLAWSSSQDHYWKDENTHADFYAYYPYMSTVSDVTAIPFSIGTDQSTYVLYKQYEVLWGKTADAAPSENPVSIKMMHSLSNILIYIKPGKGYTEETLSQQEISIKVGGTVLGGTLNLSNGTVTAKGEVGEITPFKEDDHYRAMLVPQKIEDVTFITLKVGESEYSLKKSGTFESGKQYNCTVTVNRTSEGISIGIGDWIVGDEDFGGTVG